MSRKITMQQLAQEAGVSTATVSRVLTGHPLVSEKTRSRVQALIDQYDYHPNAVARSLARQQSNMLGMLVQDIENPYFAAMYLEAEKYANAQGYTLLMASSLSFHNERETALSLLDRQVDGMIMISSSIDLQDPPAETLDFMHTIRRKLPIVLINEPVTSFDGPYVAASNREGYLAAARYLISLGHREIAFIGGQANTTTTMIRYNALCEALSENGVKPDPLFLRLTGSTVESGVQGMLELLSRGRLPTAVITFNDLVALGVLKVCRQQDLRVPNDLSIISCDNSYISQAVQPELTSIDVQPEAQGARAVEVLLQLVNGEDEPPAKSQIPALLKIRGSAMRLAKE